MHFVDPKVTLFMQVVVVVGLPLFLWRVLGLGRVFPLPIIQIFAGILLGPSIFGAVAPDAFHFLFRSEVLFGVKTLANVAVVLFVFLAGCEADRHIMHRSGSMVLRVGISGVFLPWIAGGLAAALIASNLPSKAVVGELGNPLLYTVAFGLCMAVTALPVLAVILRELGFNQKPIGTIALAVAGVDDAILWLSLAVLLPFAAGGGDFASKFAIAATGGALTVLAMTRVITPSLERLMRGDTQERLLISIAVLVLFVAAALNEATGLHAAIGAFLTGLLLPDKIRHMCQDRFDAPVTLLLLPFLFLATGLDTKFSFSEPTVWIIVLVALAVCVGGKFIGITVPAYISGESAPFSLTLGALMQCKGLMEIVVVTVLAQKGVIGPITFSALVLVALISTAMTVPLARLCVYWFGDAATQPRERTSIPVSATTAGSGATAPTGPVLDFGADLGQMPIHKSEVIIGRHSTDDIRIDDARVSRHHALLRATNATYEIHNQTAVRSEPNPILVNGVPKEHAVLSDGDTISLGGVTFKLRLTPS